MKLLVKLYYLITVLLSLCLPAFMWQKPNILLILGSGLCFIFFYMMRKNNWLIYLSDVLLIIMVNSIVFSRSIKMLYMGIFMMIVYVMMMVINYVYQPTESAYTDEIKDVLHSVSNIK